MIKILNTFFEGGPRVKNFAETLWKKYFNTPGFKGGKVVNQWQFAGRKPHAKQILEVNKDFNKTTRTLTTCYASTKQGNHPIVRETITQFKNGTKQVDIFKICGNEIIKASGAPNSKAVLAVQNAAYGLNSGCFRIH